MLWVFGPHRGVPKTDAFAFGSSGRIENYSHPNEHSWRLNAGVLEIYNDAGVLMWVAASPYVENNLLHLVLSSRRDPSTKFVLVEFAPRRLQAESKFSQNCEAPGKALSPAGFLFPDDLNVTPVRFNRVLLIGSCMTALYHERFQVIAPETKFDYLVFNNAGELPPPTENYDLQYVQLPLRSVLTDRIIWATKFHDEGFVEDILNSAYTVIDAMLASALAYTESHGLLTFVSNFIVPQMSIASSLTARYSKFDIAHIVRNLNDHLARCLHKYKNVFLADVNGVAESIGKQYVLDDMINFYSHNGAFFREWIGYERPARIEAIPPMEEFYHSKRLEFTEAVYQQIIATYRTYWQIDQVKAVIFDLDHTLWRGQLAEDYRADGENWPHPDGWPPGIWEAVHHLRARGILVSICSKNDLESIQRNWGNAVEPAFLKLEDFVSVKINWLPKAENILEICKEMNIKPKNVVFVDDNPVERAAVKSALPDIRVIGANPYLTRRILLWAPETQVTYLTSESATREDMIRSQIVRETERTTLSREAFLNSLNSKVVFTHIYSSAQPSFNRAVELVNKTNQFNTTGKRWAPAEISDFLDGGGSVITFKAADRFTDYGIVGVLFIKGNNIIQFVMSCRVLGMDVELFAISYVVTLIRAKNLGSDVFADLRETPDNQPCRDVFSRSGFVSLAAEAGIYKFTLSPDAMPVRPPHIQ